MKSAIISLCLAPLALAMPWSDPNAPRVILQTGDHKSETGGNIGCFGVDGTGYNKIKEVVKITPGFGIFFYTETNCVRATRINDGKPPQTYAGRVAGEVSWADVKSIRLVKVENDSGNRSGKENDRDWRNDNNNDMYDDNYRPNGENHRW